MTDATPGRPIASSAWFPPARVAWWLTLGFVVLALVALRYPPRLGLDFGQLLAGWDYFRRTGDFNQQITLNAADIARDQPAFITWWSPGPVVATGVFELAGLPLGIGLAGWLAIAAPLQIWGLKKLYEALGFEPAVTSLSLLAVAVGWHTLYAFRLFAGGDLFAGAVFPWAAYAMIRACRRPLTAIPVSALVVFVGSLFKLSLLVALLAFGIALIAMETEPSESAGPGRWKQMWRIAWPLGLGCAAGAALLQVVFLSKGVTPASTWPAPHSLDTLMHALGMSLVLPWWSVSSLVSLSGRALDALHLPHLEESSGLLALMVGASAFVYHLALHHGASPRVRRLLTAFIVVYVLAFTRFYFTGAAVSYEDRLFRPAGLLLLPALVACALSGASRLARGSCIALLMAGALWGVASYLYNVAELARTDRMSARRYALAEIPVAVEQTLIRIDAALTKGNNLFIVGSTEGELAIRRNRVVSTGWIATTGEFHGRVDNLLLVLPESLPAEPWLRRFADYAPAGWRQANVAGWNFCWQGAQIRLP